MSDIDTTPGRQPVVVRGRLEEPLSRWLWLVKWFLLIPHFVLLAFLWIAFAVVSVVAFVAILVTGRYPPSLFSFNLGVLRWSWRVMYYGYSALGTDRYPPFSLGEVRDYPATLDIAYPQHLSRGLVLVKWWLLALPHYLVLAFLLGGAAWTTQRTTDGTGAVVLDSTADAWTMQNGGLIGLLVLFAGVAVLFTARYPRALFDLVVGLNRWVLRVTAYVALMTDVYPPFRLDQGGDEPSAPAGPPVVGPGSAAAEPPVPRPAAPADGPAAPAEGPAAPAGGPAAPTGSRSVTGPVIALVVGLLGLLPALALTALGGSGLWLDSRRDQAGFVSTDTRTLATPTAAITVEDVDLELDRGTSTWLRPDRFGTVRVRATAPDGGALFVGVAPQSAVEAWLGPVAHDQVRDIAFGDVTYVRAAGEASAGPPTAQGFWATQVSGPGTQTLSWPVTTGRWALVIARADGAPGVQARVDVGANIPSLTGIAVGLLVAGILGVVVCGTLVVVGAVGLGRRSGGPSARGPAPAPPPPGPRPAPPSEFRPADPSAVAGTPSAGPPSEAAPPSDRR
jgi:hypothetical protein